MTGPQVHASGQLEEVFIYITINITLSILMLTIKLLIGLRIVTPQNSDQFALESSRHFDEAFGLSYAQQLKNKDIPEGGSKAVVIVKSHAQQLNNKDFHVRKSVKAFTDSLLDLIVHDSVKNIVDHYGKEELIYLGPDEQVIPSDIDWICERAAERGYPIPAAFMSSKKGAGINHKEYGVTSEGVVVYLDVALKHSLNIDPRKDPFTIKITGGPDGDVAGNLIKILFREYGSNCKVVGIADGFGVAEDPNGLDANELLRLVEEALPITSFNRSKLGSEGVLFDIVSSEGLSRRLTMCFRVKSDAFVPAGDITRSLVHSFIFTFNNIILIIIFLQVADLILLMPITGKISLMLMVNQVLH